MKEIHGSTGFWRRGNDVVFSSLLVPFGSFLGMNFFFSGFNGYYEFSIKKLPYFFCMSVFSQSHRPFSFILQMEMWYQIFSTGKAAEKFLYRFGLFNCYREVTWGNWRRKGKG